MTSKTEKKMDIKVPALAENVTTGTVVKIFVKVGDSVSKGQDLLEMETEKAVAAVPSTASGRVTRIAVSEGDQVKVGQVIMSVQEGSGGGVQTKAEPASPKAEKASKTAPAAKVKPEVLEDTGEGEPFVPEGNVEVVAAPSVRKVARQLGIDLSRVKSSEASGRITMEDLKNHLGRIQKLAFVKKDIPVGAAPIQKKSVELPDFAKWGPVRKESMSMLRKKISESMSLSWATVPHVTQFDEVDVTHVMSLAGKYAAAYAKQGAKLTLTVILLNALLPLLKKYPVFNSTLDESAEEIIYKEYIHLGIAVDTEQGLIVPVIKDADKKSVLQLSKELMDLAKRTRDRKVSLDELQGGTFTLSNQGGIGGSHFTPIVYVPQVAILGLGRGGLKPAVVNGKVAIRSMLPVGLSYDHRVIDGGSAARFIREFSENLANFDEKELKLEATKTPKKANQKKKK